MFFFAMQIVLTLGIGGLLFLAARKVPVLVALSEEATPREKRAIMDRVKELNIAKHKERFNIDALKVRKGEKMEEDKLTRQEEFDQEGDYWTKVKGK